MCLLIFALALNAAALEKGRRVIIVEDLIYSHRPFWRFPYRITIAADPPPSPIPPSPAL